MRFRTQNMGIAILYCCLLLVVTSEGYSQDSNAGTYTYYTLPSDVSGRVVQVSVDMSVHEMADSIVRDGKLFFPSMQVNLGPKVRGENDGGHIGLQYNGGAKASNWGGYFTEGETTALRFPPFYDQNTVPDNENARGNKIAYPMTDATYGAFEVLAEHFDPGTYTQVNHRNSDFFDWQKDHWYRLVVFRGDESEKRGDYWPWKGFIKDLEGEPYKSYFIGTLYSKAHFVDSFMVWVETGFNDDRKFDVGYVFPKYRTTTAKPLDLTQTEIIAPAMGAFAVARNPHNTVVAPTREYFESAARTTWHRNGLPTPSDAYRSKVNP